MSTVCKLEKDFLLHNRAGSIDINVEDSSTELILEIIEELEKDFLLDKVQCLKAILLLQSPN